MGTETERLSAIERLRPLMRSAAAAREPDERGFIDLLDEELAPTGVAQRLMVTRMVPAIYERWWRPALTRAAKGFTGPGMAEEVRIARLLLGLGEGEKVLDVACGPGNFSREFARTVGPQGLVAGLDASPTMLERGATENRRAGIANLVLIRGDATALPFNDAVYDATCCFAALHLFSDPFAALDEMTRVLAPGGRIALMTSVRRQLTARPLKPLLERSSGIKLFESEEITGALADRGFTGIHQRLAGMVQFAGARLPAAEPAAA